jgi:hypothetical protein
MFVAAHLKINTLQFQNRISRLFGICLKLLNSEKGEILIVELKLSTLVLRIEV